MCAMNKYEDRVALEKCSFYCNWSLVFWAYFCRALLNEIEMISKSKMPIRNCDQQKLFPIIPESNDLCEMKFNIDFGGQTRRKTWECIVFFEIGKETYL